MTGKDFEEGIKKRRAYRRTNKKKRNKVQGFGRKKEGRIPVRKSEQGEEMKMRALVGCEG